VPKQDRKNNFYIWLARIFDLGKVMILLAMVIYIVHLFFVSVFVVSGASMEPSFYDREYLVVNKISLTLKQPGRGEVVVFKFPGELKEKYIKRVIGLPGETVELKNQAVFINGLKLTESYLPKEFVTEQLGTAKKWQLKDKEFFVMGDNRPNSNDSRVWGPLPQEDLIGKISYVLFPFSEHGRVPSPKYLSTK